MKQGRFEEATASLAYMRREDPTSPELVQEIAEIKAALDEEEAATEGVTWKECISPVNRYRFLAGILIMFWQQFSGTNSIGYYVSSSLPKKNSKLII